MRKILLFTCAFLSVLLTQAQLTGPKAIPGDYATIAAAVTDLNTQGVGAGGVTFNVAAGHTETLAGKITITATGTAANPVIFQKSGAGANPVLTSYTGTVATPSVIADGFIVLAGSDYITFDGINLQEAAANTTTTTVMEFGYGLFLASASDGCQNNTIRNCSITLNRINNTAWTAPGHNGTVGIAMVNALNTATGAVTITAATGSNSFNRFYSNTIQNCNAGIAITGYAAPSPFTLGDTNNDVGGASAATGNTVLNYGGGAATSPATGIFASNQWGFNCSYNTVNNNDGGGVNHATTLRGIFLSTAVSASANCNNNTVTVNSGATTSQLTGIDVQSGSTAAGNTINVNNNIVQNCTYATATSGTFQGISTTTSASILNVNNNRVSDNTQSGTGQYDGILITSTPASATANNNNISNNIKTGTGIMHGIYHSGAATNVTYDNNSITNNQIQGASGTLYGLRLTTSIFIVSNNAINSNSIPNTSGATASSVYGIFDGSSPTSETIYGNTINTLSIGGAGTSTTSIIAGINLSTSSASIKNIYSNTIYDLQYSNTATGSATVTGISQSLGSSVTMYNNKIYDLAAVNGAASLARGITIASGTTLNIFNNLIGNLQASASANADAIRGIGITSTTATSTLNISFNTIYLNGSSSGTNFGTSGLFHTYSVTATTASLVIRNNIIVNTSTATGTGVSTAFRRSSATDLNNYNSASNNNLFYAGTPSATSLIYYDGTNSDQTLTAFKTRVAARESNSITESPNFLSTSGASANFLHINTTTGTQIESGGIPVTGITDDYDGNARNVTTPDIGADEFNGISTDLLGPAITYTPFGFTCSTADRTLNNVTITDVSGVPTSGTLVPRIYYRKNAGAWFSQPGTLSSGTATNGIWNFTIVVADMGGVAVGDIVQYYMIAQDVAGTPNIGSNPAGATATDVNNVSAAPASPASYTISATLSGTYTVGAAGNYATLTAAVAAYNTSCLSGPVVFELIDAAYSTSETFPLVILNNPDASATNTLTIRPATGVAVTITGTSGAVVSALMRLNGARYITFDGLNTGGASLLVENTSATTGTAVFWLSSNGAGSGANNNIIRNTSIRGGITQNTSNLVSYGIVVAGGALSATATSITAGDDNDNTTIQGNTFTRLRYCVFIRGGSIANPNTGTVISGNTFGPAAYGNDQIGRVGVVAREEDGIQITNNTFRHIGGDYAGTPTTGVDRIAIALTTDGNWTNSTSTPPTVVMVKNALVTRNVIYNITDERTFSAAGIVLSTADGGNPTNNLVANNMISNIKANGTASDQTVGIGIGSGNGDKIVFNSIYCAGGDTDPNASATAATQTNTGINITTTSVTNIDVRNNIVHMDLFSSSAPTLRTACVGIPASYTWGTGGLNYNNYYVPAANTVAHIGVIGGTSGTFYLTLANWQAAATQDANATNVQPVFTSSTNLHLSPAGNAGLSNTGTPVAGITTDIDNDTRDATNPDMGADEFTAPAGVDLIAISLLNPVVKTCYTNAETVTMRIQNGSSSLHDFSVNPVTLTINVTGATTATLNATVNTGTLASGATLDVNMSTTLDMSAVGTYTINGYLVASGDTNLGNDTLAAVARTVVALTAGTVTSGTPSYCVTGGTPALTRTGGTGIGNVQWQESIVSGAGPWTNVGTNSNTYIPGAAITATTYYRAVVSCNGNTAPSNVDTVELDNPQVTGTTPGSRCGPGTVTLAATSNAGIDINWFAAASGGASLGTGPSFITPSLIGTTTYYAEAGNGAPPDTVGPATPTTLGTPSVSNIAIGTQYMLFNVTGSNAKIETIDVYPTAAVGSNFSIVIRNSAGTDIFTTGTLTTTVTGGATAQTVTLNAPIPVGTGYRLGFGINPNMQRNTTGASYPYTAPGILSFTGNSFDPVYWYFFYNIKVSAGCVSPRTAVTATINPIPALAAIAGGGPVCQAINMGAAAESFFDGSCNLIATVTPSGSPAVSGNVNTCVTIDNSVQVDADGHPYVQRHHDIEPATGAATAQGTIKLYYTQAEFDAYNTYVTTNSLTWPLLPTGGADNGNVRITQFHGTGTAPGNYTGGKEYIIPAVSWNATNSWWEVSFPVTGFSGFYLHTGAQFLLPIGIGSLNARVTGTTNTVYWTTETEVNNRKFIIERSADGRVFQAIGEVNSIAPNGNSTTTLAYRFADNNPLNGKQFYRLRIVDRAGNETLSPMVSLRRGEGSMEITDVRPNPTTGMVQFSITGGSNTMVNIVVRSMNGKDVLHKTNIPAGSFSINLGGMANGVYLLEATDTNNGERAVYKLVKQ